MTSTHLSLHYPLVFSTRARHRLSFEKGSCSESMHRLSVRFVMVTPAPTMKRFRFSGAWSLLQGALRPKFFRKGIDVPTPQFQESGQAANCRVGPLQSSNSPGNSLPVHRFTSIENGETSGSFATNRRISSGRLNNACRSPRA